MTNEELNAQLRRNLRSEQDSYRRWLMQQSPALILAEAYKYAMWKDILLCFEHNLLPDTHVTALLYRSDLMDDLVAQWELACAEHPTEIWHLIQEYAKKAAKRRRKAKGC